MAFFAILGGSVRADFEFHYAFALRRESEKRGECMSGPALTPTASDDLQFETVESQGVNTAATGPGRKCVGCGQPIVATYFAVGDKTVCPTCCERIKAPIAGSRLWSFVKAALLGVGAGLIGAAIWFTVRWVAHMELGIVAILVGLMVGKAVRKGSGNRGGVGYQVLAVLITYCCIAANYMPDIAEFLVQDAREHHRIAAPKGRDQASVDSTKDDAIAGESTDVEKTKPRNIGFSKAAVGFGVFFAVVFATSLAAPFLAGAQNAIGLLIIGFALWEAWKLNRRRRLAITGPYQLGTASAAS